MRMMYMPVLFLIVACTTPRPAMIHVDDDADYDKDYEACLQQAEESLPDSRHLLSSITVNDSILEKRILLCMKHRGWLLKDN